MYFSNAMKDGRLHQTKALANRSGTRKWSRRTAKETRSCTTTVTDGMVKRGCSVHCGPWDNERGEALSSEKRNALHEGSGKSAASGGLQQERVPENVATIKWF